MVLTTTLSIPSMAQTPSTAAGAGHSPSTASDPNATARRLSAGVARGNEAAFREFYDAYCGRVFRLAFVLARGNDLLAQDAVQSAFLTAAARLPAVKTEEHLWNWLALITRQHLAKAWRKQQRDAKWVDTTGLPDDPEPPAPDKFLGDCLNVALQSMETGDREILEWFYFDGLSQKDIAEKFGGTPKAVSSRLERARAKLRAAITHNLSHET